jgi:hypothetical protein
MKSITLIFISIFFFAVSASSCDIVYSSQNVLFLQDNIKTNSSFASIAPLRETCCSFASVAPLRDTSFFFASIAPLRDIGCSSAPSAPLRETFFSFASIAPLRDIGCITAFSAPLRGCSRVDSLPALNTKILSFVNSKMHKKVGRGECWDLAAEALNASGAKWNGKLNFGRKLEKGEGILPGDIIQFEGVKIKFQEGNAKYTQVLKHHTGIIYSVKGNQQFDMANQNTAEHGRKVSLVSINLDDVTTGHFYIYRPVEE